MATVPALPNPSIRGALPLSAGNPQVPDAGARRGIHARQALAGACRSGGGAQAGHQPFAARRQDRDGLSRLRPAARRTHRRRQCRHDAGGEALRSGSRLPPCDLRHVVDPRRDPGIHPALVVAGEDRHDRARRKSCSSTCAASRADQGDRGRRSFARDRSRRSRTELEVPRRGRRQHEPPPGRPRSFAQRAAPRR